MLCGFMRTCATFEISMENKLVSEEDLKHFHASLLGNEEDAKWLLNVKQEGLSCIYLIVASSFT